jgi:phage-related protein
MPSLEVRHFTTAGGRDVIAEFLDRLPAKAAAKCLTMTGRLASGDIHLYPKSRTHVRSGIWELRVPHGGEQYRFLYFVEGRMAYLLVPIHKKTQRLEDQDIRLAEQRRSDILSGRSRI